MKKMDELMTTLKLDELLNKRDNEKKKNTLLWVLAIPLGLLGGFVFHWSAPVVFFCLRCDNIVKSILGFIRLCSGRWVRVVTRPDAVQEA